MSARHRHLYVAGDTAVHAAAPHAKVLATLVFVFAVVATPREAVWAFGVDGFVVVVVALAARVPIGHLVGRLVIELPFLLFALFLPIVGRDPRVEVLGVSLSQPGLWAAWAILAKGSLGVAATVVLASTTPIPDLLRGLERLRVPAVLVAITAFMVRYGDVLGDELQRMRIARASRGADPRWIFQARGVASTAGTLFVRSFERGERVHFAMQARGYAGTLPPAESIVGRRRRLLPAGRRRRGCGSAGMGAAVTPAVEVPAVEVPAVEVPAVEVRALSFRYPDGTPALDGIDLTVRHGERLAVLGPNGAGKSTLTLHLNGIHTATTGTVTIDGLPVTPPNLREIRRRVGLVFQDPDDQLFMPTVRDDVAFGPANLGLRGDELHDRVTAALDAVGMADVADRAPHHLSFGQRRRVAVATVLAMRPTVLVLDEPSSNLDPLARRELADILDGLAITVVIVTHDLPYAMQLCESAIVLNEGRITARGAIAEILADDEVLAANRLELPYGFSAPRVRR